MFHSSSQSLRQKVSHSIHSLSQVKGSNFASFDAPISYFTNPSYPEPDSMPNYSTLTIKVLKFK